MKKLIAVCMVLGLLLSCAAAETDLSALSFDELLALREKINAEIVTRPEWKEVTVPSGTWKVGTDIPAGVYSLQPTSRGGYITITRNGRHIVSQGIRSKSDAYGRIELMDGDTVEIERGSIIFTPPQGLGF